MGENVLFCEARTLKRTIGRWLPRLLLVRQNIDQTVDVTAAAFAFDPVTDADPNTIYESNEITISGLDDLAEVRVTMTIPDGGGYLKNGQGSPPDEGGLTYLQADTTARNGDRFLVAIQSSGNAEGEVTITLGAGGVSGTFTVTTAA